MKGKLGYLAPEQILGQSLDVRTDLFAVGVVLYELLAGERPWAPMRSARDLAAALRALASFGAGELGPLRLASPRFARADRRGSFRVVTFLVTASI
ncbi:MAG TPA: hypothetical protein VGG39_09170 [Polyangiaceae bacterium]